MFSFDKFIGDDDTLDLRDAVADLGDLGVPEEAFEGIFLRIAVGSEDLYGVLCNLHGRLRGEALGHGKADLPQVLVPVPILLPAQLSAQ